MLVIIAPGKWSARTAVTSGSICGSYHERGFAPALPQRAIRITSPRMRPRTPGRGEVLPRDLAELAGLEVADGLANLGVGVHHERAVAGDRRVDRLATEQEEASVRAGREMNAIALAEHGQLALALEPARDRGAALDLVLHHVPARGCTGLEVGAGLERPVLIEDRCAGLDRGLHAARFAGDHLHASVRRGADGNARARDLLIARRHLLVPRRQVDPDLETVDPATLVADPIGRFFAVDHTRARGHPLDVARAERAAMARGVLVLAFALEEVRDGLESAMRVIGRADGLAGRVIDRTHLVDQQEWVDVIDARDRERSAHHEPTAFDVTFSGDQMFDSATHDAPSSLRAARSSTSLERARRRSRS